MWEDEYPVWERCYPTPAGGTVLDVGADPESVRWFLEHGVRRVIPIGELYGSHLDAVKIDIEGAERGLVVETHFRQPRLVLLHRWPNGAAIWRLDGGDAYDLAIRNDE